jgi:mucin-19
MAIVKRFNKLLGLEKIDVLVDEKGKSRHIVITDIPETLPQGKSSFLIEASPYMKTGIELQIDFFDSKGNSIYVEPVQNYLEGSSRTVSVEVYDTVAPGIATMIIVGELESIPLDAGNFSDTQEIPDDFKGVYNVRLTKEFIINTAKVNVQPIKFYSSPRLTAIEKRFGTLEREAAPSAVTSSAFKVTGQSTIQQQYETFDNPSQNDNLGQGAGTTETQENQAPPPPDGNIKGDKAEIEKLKQHAKKKSIRGNSRFKRSRRIRRRNSPEDFPYFFTIRDDEHRFTTKEIGAEIRFSAIDTSIYSQEDLGNSGLETPTFNVVTDVNDVNYPSHYTASIAKLDVTGRTAYVNTPFTKQDKEGNYRILNVVATGKTHYTPEATASYSITNIVSYADVTLSHLRTFSGEVFKAKVYVRAEGSFDDYKLLAEVPVESPELMINANSVGVGERTGYFVSETDKNTYWSVSGSTNGLTAATATSTASYQESTTMLDSVMISGSTSVFTDQIRFQLKDTYKFNLTKGVDYDLSFKAVGKKDIDNRALMLVYISGSSVKQSNTLHFDDANPGVANTAGEQYIPEPSQYGKRMGVLEVKNDFTDSVKDFELVRHNFNTNTDGDAIVQFRVIAGQWNISDISVVPSTDTGFSPSFINFQQQLSPELTHKRPETLEFLTEFYDINNNLADEIAVTTGSVFTGGNMVITGDDNNMSGDLFIGGDTTASGMHFGGVSSKLPETGTPGADGSGFMRSVGYLGFTSASAQSGSYGFMIYSGSVLPNSGDSYKGVGLELVGASGSLKFRTNPSVFDVQADSFFVGKTNTQFISGSGEKIEISSSNFHVTPEGNVTMSGTITAEAGNIGGFNIEDSRLTAGVGNSAVTMSGASQLFRFGSGSQFDTSAVDGILFGKDTDGKYKFAIGKGTSYILFDGTNVNIRSEDINVTASVFSVDVDVFKLSANNLFISSSGGGFISAGNPRPTGIGGSNKGFFIQGNDPSDGKAKFLVGAATASHISFDGTNIFMSSSAFFLGGPSQFVSGSGGNIEISSSNFHLDRNGNVKMTGTVTANAGNLGGFSIGGGAISSNNFFISGSATGNQFFISSSNFNIKASGDVTASALDLTGGSIAGLSVSSGVISVGTILKLKDTGEITGSKVLFTGGKVGGFTIDADEIKSTNVLIDSANEKITLGSANAIKLQGGGTDNFIAMGSKSTFSNEGTGTAGIIVGMDGTNPQAEFVKDSNNYFIFDDGIDIKTDTLKASGSNIILEAPNFFLGKTSTTFVSGSDGKIQISSSAFHLTPQGNVTASSILLGDKANSNYLQFVDDTLTVRGDLAVDSLFLPATIGGSTSTVANASSSLDSRGFAKFVSASIGGFNVNSTQISSAGNNIILKADGGATISGSSIDLKTPKFYLGNQTNFISGSDGNIKIFSSGATTLSGSSVNLQTPKFYFGESGNFISGSGGNIKIFSTGDTTLSGSSITLATPKFYLGQSTQYISGSGGNIEISSSNFHLTADGNVTMSGIIKAAGGTIGGFVIGDDLTSSAGTLKLEGASGRMTASAAKITGNITAQTGTIGGFNIGTDLDSAAGTLKLKGASGQITASAAQITGKVTATTGQIAGFTIDGNTLTATNFTLDASGKRIALGTGTNIFIADGDEGIQLGHGTFASAPFSVTKAGVLKSVSGTIGGWVLSSTQLKNSADEMRIDSSALSISIKNHTFGQAGIQLQYNSGTTQFYVGDGSNKHLKFSGGDVDIKTEKLIASGSSINLGAPSFRLGSATNFISGSGGTLVIQNSGTTTLSGSAVNILTPSFFLGATGSAFVSGSSAKIEISSSKFHLQSDGDVVMNNVTASNINASGKITATTGEIGGFTIGGDLSNSAGSTLKLKGSSGQITASSAQISGSIVADNITANTKGTIGNFTLDGVGIKSSNSQLILSASGQITASNAKIEGRITANSGQIAGFSIDGNTLTATNFTLDASGKRITLGTGNNIFIADGDEGIQLGHATFGSAPFSVTKAGVLKATSGTIGGWTLSGTQISSNNLIMDSAGVIQTSDYASNVKGWRLSPANSGEAEFQNVKIRGTLSTAVFEKETVNAVGGQLYIANSTALTGSATVAATSTTMSVANVGGFTGSYSNDGEVLSAKKVSATGFATEYMLVQSASRDFPTSETDFRGKLYVVRGYQSGSTGTSGSLGDSSNISQSFEPGQVIVSTGKIGTGFIRLNANPNDVTTPYIDIVERTGSGVYAVDLKARLGDLSGLSSGLLYGNASPGFGLFTENVFLKGAITATTGSFTGQVHVGTTNGIVIDGNAKKIFQGTGTHNNSNTGFYMDSTGKFSLKDKLVWDGSNLTITGTVNISAGSGFATAASVSGSFPSAASVSSSLNASSSALQGNIDDVETNVSGAFTATSASTAARIVTDASNKIVVPNSSPSGNGLFLTSRNLGFYNSGWNAFISSSGAFLFKADNNNLVSFGTTVSQDGTQTSTTNFVLKAENAYLSGSSVNILTERFFLGSGNQFISGSQGNLKIFAAGDTTISGSSVEIQTPKFFLGKVGSQFVSGSNNKIEISSSKFHLQNDGDVIMNDITASNAKISGDITATNITATTKGNIGGFVIGSNKISSSAGGLTLNADGGITGSKFLLTGGTITSDVTILGSLSANSIATGPGDGVITAQITAGGLARFVSASIGGFDVNSTTISDTGNNLIMSSSGQITGSSVLFTGGKIGGWTLGSSTLTGGVVTLNSAGSIEVGSLANATTTATTNSGFFADSSGNVLIKGNTNNKDYIKFSAGGGIDINTQSATISGSSIILKTNDFFLGQKSSQFVSGSANNIEISSSAFHLDTANNTMIISGSITATDGKIGGMLLENNKLKSQYGDGTVFTKIVTVAGSSVYYIDGVQQATVSLKVGNVYRFDNSHSSNGGHPFRFATSADGTIYSTGVSVVGSEGSGGTAYVQITVTEATPSTLYYKCTSHGSMGGQLNIITIGTLELNGVNGQITGSDVLISGGKISGSNLSIDVPNVTMSGSSVDIRTPKFYLGETSQYISGSNGNIEISSSNFHLDNSGNVVMSGNVTATTGEIGGFTIDADEIKAGTTLILDSDTNNGEIKLGSAALDSGDGIYMNGSGVFRVGDFNGNRLHFDGTNLHLTASKVNISGSSVKLETPRFYLGETSQFISGSNGNIEISSSKFHVKPDGDIVVRKVSATEGTIGGWDLSGTTLANGSNIVLDSTNKRISINNATFGNDGLQMEHTTGGAKLYVGDGSNKFFKFDGTDVDIRTEKLTASGSSINLGAPSFRLGSASNFISGSGGGLVIQSSGTTTISGSAVNIETPAFFMGATGSAFISGSGNKMQISSSKFQIKSDGDLIVRKISATDGTIGGFTIDQRSITATNFSLDSPTALISIGTGTNAFGNANRIFLDGDNNKFSVGTQFKFDSTGLEVSGSSIRLGAPSFKLGSANNFISGSGGGLVIQSSGTTTLSGSAVNILTPSFFLGATGSAYVSGSTNKLEISSSKFHMKSSGDLIVRKVDATEGTIGGFTLNPTEISASGLLLKSNGQITASAMSMSGAIVATSGEIGGFRIGTDLDSTAGTLKLKGASGQITASDALISGNITANTINATGSGVIGGFTINSTEISASGLLLKSSGQITASAANLSGKVTATSGQIGGNTLTSGSIFSGTGTFNATNTPFFLDSGGRFSLKNKLSFNGSSLTVQGDITAITGQIGGWGISGDILSSTQSDSVELDGENERITISSNTFGNTGIQLENNGGNPRAFIGKTNGSFLKFNSQTDILQISSSTFELGSKASAFISASSTGTLEISSSNFHLSPLGNITASNANFQTVTIRGGTADNDVSSDSNQSFVGGGTFNLIQQSSFNSVIGAGAHNLINLGSDFSSILSGVSCSIDSHSDRSFIGAGSGSKIISSSNQSFLGAGATNTIKFASSSFIGAGINNSIVGDPSQTPNDVRVGDFPQDDFSAKESVIVAGSNNKITLAYQSFIGSGQNNVISGSVGTINTGFGIYLDDLPFLSSIVGGLDNEIKNLQYGSFIGGGQLNKIKHTAPVTNIGQAGLFNSIVGGQYNEITSNNSVGSFAGWNFIGGGSTNKISGSAYSLIGGGNVNIIHSNVNYSTIVGGKSNVIGSSTSQPDYSFIGGGYQNEITGDDGDYNVVVGGEDNTITGTGNSNFIGSGEDNVISSTGNYNAILGGEANTIGSSYTDTFIIGSGITANASNTTFVEGLNASGNITVGGTVDGVDVATIGGYLNQAVKTTSTPYFSKITLGKEAASANVGTIYVTSNDGDDGLQFVRDDTTTTVNEILGGIGFDSTDGNVPSSILESSAFIAGFASETHTTGDKGGYLRMGVSPVDQNNDTASDQIVHIDQYGMRVGKPGTGDNWISLYAESGDAGSGAGISFYETGTFDTTLGTHQYGAKIVYNETDDILHIGTIQNSTFTDQLRIPRADTIISTLHVVPRTDNFRDLGQSGLRWDDVFATNGTINTSDRNEKTQISGSDLGLDFVNSLNPVKYQFKFGSRTHYGLVAQEVSQSLTGDFAGYIEGRTYQSGSEIVTGKQWKEHKDQRGYGDWEDWNLHSTGSLGLRYNEFISPMIKAIQELSSQVESLRAQISGSG